MCPTPTRVRASSDHHHLRLTSISPVVVELIEKRTRHTHSRRTVSHAHTLHARCFPEQEALAVLHAK